MAVAEVRKKWHLPPAFNVEYVAYYEDRNNRIQDLKVYNNLKIVIRVDDTKFVHPKSDYYLSSYLSLST